MFISITNIIVQNGGDAAIMLGMIKSIKKAFGDNCVVRAFTESESFCKRHYPDIESGETFGRLAVSSPYNAYRIIGRRFQMLKAFWYMLCGYLYSKGFPLCMLPLRQKAKSALKSYGESDIVISCGGTYLVEAYGIYAQYVDYKVVKFLHKPFFFYTQSIGHFSYPKNRRWLFEMFEYSKAIFLRDCQSFKNVCNISQSFKNKCSIFADAAFCLLDHSVVPGQKRLNPLVAISVRKWIHARNPNAICEYRRAMAASIIWLIEHNYEVQILSTCQGNLNYTDDNDEADAILEQIPVAQRNKILRCYDVKTPLQIIDILRRSEFLIATRLHMAILGCISGIPVLPIAYEFKTEELFKNEFGYPTILNTDSITAELLIRTLNDFVVNMEAYSSKIHNKIGQLAQNSCMAAERLCAITRAF